MFNARFAIGSEVRTREGEAARVIGVYFHRALNAPRYLIERSDSGHVLYQLWVAEDELQACGSAAHDPQAGLDEARGETFPQAIPSAATPTGSTPALHPAGDTAEH